MSTTDSRPDHDSSPLLGLGCNEGLGPLRELAAEGAALHSPGQPERMICDGLLAALDEVQKLRAAMNEALPFTMSMGQKLLAEALGPNA